MVGSSVWFRSTPQHTARINKGVVVKKHSNLNRVFHALKKYHGRRMSRKRLKALAVVTARECPWFHRFTAGGVDAAPWLDGTPSGPTKWG